MTNNLVMFIAIAAIVAVILTVVTILFLVKKEKKIPKISAENSSKIVDALGGIENIISFEGRISRISIIVNDINIVDSEKIKEISQCGMTIVGSKVQLILKDNSESFKQVLTDLEMSDHN